MNFVVVVERRDGSIERIVGFNDQFVAQAAAQGYLSLGKTATVHPIYKP